ncbi:hypothetical protein GW579_23500 [Rahnella sp. Lac-M11]|uniref:Uncharacterized protein n=1 Tax=Rahnella contaminans TaxID=2703882 RepID=A0A6M2B9L6_9GAMM|nr:hypothetical protein [Rahnella contaminans]NGX90046.1 hypothetical protein [Rahnella contaminans]
MKLDTYVEETIKQIITGISAAQEFGEKNNAKVNPASVSFNHNNSTNVFCTNTGVPIQQIEFDIVVSVNEGNSSTDAPEITVGSSTISGSAQSSETTNTSTNRIKFSIPVLLPISGKRL